MAPLRYLIVGSGYRAEYYGRIAMMYPELFRAMYLCRSEEKTARMTKNTGCPATVSREEALAFGPDFIVEAVDRSHGSDVSLEWAEQGFPVMAETPVAASWAQWKAVRAAGERGAQIVCLEQYHRYPILMAGIEAVRRGDIGQPLSCYLSLCHDYHAASLLRRMLGTAGESYVMHGIAQEHQAAETDSRCGAVLDGTMKPRQRDVVHIAYASGKTALYCRRNAAALVAGSAAQHLAHVPDIGRSLGSLPPLLRGLIRKHGGVRAAVHTCYIPAPVVFLLQQSRASAIGTLLHGDLLVNLQVLNLPIRPPRGGNMDYCKWHSSHVYSIILWPFRNVNTRFAIRMDRFFREMPLSAVVGYLCDGSGVQNNVAIGSILCYSNPYQ